MTKFEPVLLANIQRENSHTREDYEQTGGYQALRKIRNHPRLADTRVVAVTAEASEEEMMKAQGAGFDGFLGKPLDPDRFPEQVRRILDGDDVWEWH